LINVPPSAPATESAHTVVASAISVTWGEAAMASFVKTTAPSMGYAIMEHVTATLDTLAQTAQLAVARANALDMANACTGGNAIATKVSQALIAQRRSVSAGHVATAHVSWASVSACQGLMGHLVTLAFAPTNAMDEASARTACVRAKRHMREIRARRSSALRIAMVTALA